MQNLQRMVESVNNLVAFEAAARHVSFSRAADELGVSQPAISQSVRRLEEAIGINLFVRHHRRITLTDAGVVLQSDISNGFQRIAQTIARLQRQGRGRHVTLSVSSAFAHYWMVPRLQTFREENPGIDLRVQQTDMELDLAEEGISLAVWRGDGVWRGYESEKLSEEVIHAMASPSWLERNGPIESLEQLKNSELITLEEPYRYRPSWKDFFAAHGERYADSGAGLRLNDYALVLHAGLAGDGVIFGWEHVTRLLVASGQLVPVGDWALRTGAGFYLVWSSTTELSDNARATRDWLITAK